MRFRLITALVAGLFAGSLATTAQANAIWSFSGTIGAAVSGDTEQLAGASVTANFHVPLPANYVDFFGGSYAPINLALTSITISGSGNAANNATFGPSLLLGSTFLGFGPNWFNGGNAQIVTDVLWGVTLPSGNTLSFGPLQITSVIAQPAAGTAVSPADFPTGPANAGSFAPAVNLASTTETYGGSGTFSLVPEPSSLALLGLGATGLAWAGRRREETA